MHDTTTGPTRRGFLRTSTEVGASILGALAVPRAVHAGVDETIRLGLVGCGQRGSGAVVDALSADPQVRLVAVADAFADRAEACVEQLKSVEEYAPRISVTPDRVFVGFEAYKQLITCGVDVVLLASPPHFRPDHLRYAVEAGKHCFVEKPIAVDAPGVRDVMKSCEEAKKQSLAIVSGLCWRYELGARETVRRIVEDKAIGDVLALDCRYLTNGLWHRGDDPQWSRMEYEIRNWLYYTWLSGDHIVEQAIHSIDKAAWILGDVHPLRAVALGGRQQRVDPQYGNIYDHFTVLYEFPEGVRVSLCCRQQDDCTAEIEDRAIGAAGTAELVSHKFFDRSGKETWKYDGPTTSMYRNEHEALFGSIRRGEPINNGHYMCNSTMMAILGREAAYTGQALEWDDVANSDQRLGPTEYSWGDAPKAVVAIPGKLA